MRAGPLKTAQALSSWPAQISAQVRARHPAQAARWRVDDDGGLVVTFVEPVLGVALGQALVAYDGDVVLGGGVITGRLDGALPRLGGGAAQTTISNVKGATSLRR